MKVYTNIWMVLLASLLAILSLTTSCAHGDPGMRMLDIRARNVESSDPTINDDLYGHEPNVQFVRKAPVVKKAWLHPHEMPNSDYFGGGFVHFVIMEDQWVREVTKEKK